MNPGKKWKPTGSLVNPYYAKHRASLLTRAKERYRNNPKIYQRVLAQRNANREAYLAKRRQRRLERFGDNRQRRARPFSKTCPHCSGFFLTRTKTKFLCSRKCADEWRSKFLRRPCHACKKVFKPQGAGRYYCSYDCYWTALKNKECAGDAKPCPTCGKPFHGGRSHYCSFDCKRIASQNRRGESGNLTRTEWNAVLIFYKRKCAYCGKKCRKFSMDHIKPVIRGGRTTMSNVCPACLDCNLRKGPKPISKFPMLPEFQNKPKRFRLKLEGWRDNNWDDTLRAWVK